MKKIKIKSKRLKIILFTILQILYTIIAAVFLIHAENCTSPYLSIFSCVSHLSMAILFERIKYDIY